MARQASTLAMIRSRRIRDRRHRRAIPPLRHPGTASERSAGRRIRDPCLAGRAPRSGARRGTRRRPSAPSLRRRRSTAAAVVKVAAKSSSVAPPLRRRFATPPPPPLRGVEDRPPPSRRSFPSSSRNGVQAQRRTTYPGSMPRRPRPAIRCATRHAPPTAGAVPSPAPLHGRGRRDGRRRILQRRAPPPSSFRDATSAPTAWGGGQAAAVGSATAAAVTAPPPSSSRNGVQAQRRTTYPGSMPRPPRPAIRCTTRHAPPTAGAVPPPAPLHGRSLRHRRRQILQRPPSVVASRRHLRPHCVGWRTDRRHRVRDRRGRHRPSASSSRNGVQAQRRTTYPGSMPRRPRPAIRCTTRPPSAGAVPSSAPLHGRGRRQGRRQILQRPSSPGEWGTQNARITASRINRLHEDSPALSTPPIPGSILRRGRRRTRAWAGRGGMDGS